VDGFTYLLLGPLADGERAVIGRKTPIVELGKINGELIDLIVFPRQLR
jgi:hypothetical protein